MPVVLTAYFAARKNGKNELAKGVIIAASMLFFALYGLDSFLVLVLSCAFNYLYSSFLVKNKKPVLLGVGIVINVFPLLIFKYLNFFGENAAKIAGTQYTPVSLILPVAISYYTFQMITWCVDSYRGETKGIPVIDYLTYIWFFPRMVMGPITRHDEFIPQINDPAKFKPDPENIATGFVWFTVGMSKKLLLATRYSGASLYGLGVGSGLGLAEAWLCTVAYTFEIYLDFSG